MQFYTAWKAIAEQRETEILAAWDNAQEYTSLIIRSENSIIKSVSSALELHCYNRDYYSLDSVLYCDSDRAPVEQGNGLWLRDITVAFEHENNFFSGLYQEVSHLLITNCVLRVLVTYPNTGELDELARLHEIISGNRSATLISNLENFLIIFGYKSPYRWEGFVYKSESWKAI